MISVVQIIAILTAVASCFLIGYSFGYDKRNTELETDFDFENKNDE